jgi:hypothetical protein
VSLLPAPPSSSKGPSSVLGLWADRLLQGFEDRRAGLPEPLDEAVATRFFSTYLEEQLPQMREGLALQTEGMADEARTALVREMENLARGVLLPAYIRLATHFTRRERNDFYLAPERLHGVERLLWSVAGMVLGAFIVWAPFIPLWSKEWVLPFALLGLVFPDLRRWWAARRYEKEVNALVLAADREASRLTLGHLMTGSVSPEPLPDSPSKDPSPTRSR